MSRTQRKASAVEAKQSIEVYGHRIFSVWRRLRRGAAMAPLRARLFGTGSDALDPGQSDALELLSRRAAWRMSEIAAELYIDPSTATRAIDRLVDAGMAVRRAATEDARGVSVGLSGRGRRRWELAHRRQVELMYDTLSEFSPEELRLMAELMERFAAAIDRAAGVPRSRIATSDAP